MSAEKSNGFPYFTGEIYPTPQKAEYFNEFITIYSPEKSSVSSCILLPKSLKTDDARIIELVEKIQSIGGKVDIRTDNENLDNYSSIISIGKTRYQGKNKFNVPQRQEAYTISLAEDNGKNLVLLDHYDEQGIYWSISSLCQLLTKKGNNIVLKKAEVIDYPEYKIRCAGIRMDRNFKDFFYSLGMELPKKYKYNTIMPCSGNFWPEMLETGKKKITDDFWRNSYPDSAFDKLAQTAAYYKDRRIDMVTMLSPHRCKNKIQFSSLRDADLLQDFTRKILNAGCSGISLWLDDTGLPLSEKDAKIFKNGGSAHAFLFRNIQEMMDREFPGRKLSLCSTLYMSNAKTEVERYKFGVVPEEYWNTLREQIGKDALFMWNGPYVCSYKVTSEQAEKMRNILDKKLFFLDFGWCGANKLEHYRFDPIPYSGRFSPDLQDYVEGYMLPVLLTPEREIFYAQVADFLWNPQAFNAETSLKKAIEKVMGPDLYPLAMKYRETISKFDYTGFKATPAVIREVKSLKSDLKNLENILASIKETYPDLAKSLKTQAATIGNFIKELEASRTSEKKYEEFEKTLLNCIQKETGIAPNDVIVFSTQFLSPNTGLYKYQCEPRYAAWIYGAEAKSTMSVRFAIDEKELGRNENAKLIICGQDEEEKNSECKISIAINGNNVFKGRSGFGTSGWFIKEFMFPLSFLKRGENILEIKNTTKSENQYGAPWFGLCYAVIRIVNEKEKQE